MDNIKNRADSTPPAGDTKWKIIRNLIFMALSAVLLYFSFRGVKWNDFIAGLKSCNYWWIVTSMFVGFMGFVFRALRWRLLLLPLDQKVTKMDAYNGVSIAYLTNFAFPRAGEIARCGVIAKTTKVSFQSALGTVVLERTFDLFCLIFWVLFILVFKWADFGQFMQKTLFQPLLDKFSVNTAIYTTAAIILLVFIVAVPFIFRKRLAGNKFFKKISSVIKGLVNGFLSAFEMKNKGMFFIYTALIWATYWLTSLTTIFAFPQVHGLTAIDALFLMIVGGLGWAVPVQGGIGAYHLIISLALFGVYGIPQNTGVIFATISHESQAFIMIICGTVSLILVNTGLKKLKKHS